MFSIIGDKVDATLAAYLTSALASVMAALLPLALAAQTLWMLLFGYEVIRGQVQEPVATFAWRAVKALLVCGIALSASDYTGYVQTTASGLMTGMVANFLPAGSVLNTTSIWTILDSFDQAAATLVLRSIQRDEGLLVLDFMPYFGALLFAIGNALLLIVAFCITLWVRVLQSFVFAIGPFFILCLMFRTTARFFEGWLAMLVSTVVLTWLVYFVLGFSVAIGSDYVDHLAAHFDDLNLIVEALTYVVIMVVFAFIIYQSPSVAASLTGGGPAQFGAGLIQQAAITYRMLGGMPGATPAASQGGGSIARGPGIPYAAGALAGRGISQASAAAGRATTALGHAAIYAYQRASRRARR